MPLRLRYRPLYLVAFYLSTACAGTSSSVPPATNEPAEQATYVEPSAAFKTQLALHGSHLIKSAPIPEFLHGTLHRRDPHNLSAGDSLAPQSTQTTSDAGGQAGWNFLPPNKAGTVSLGGAITVAYVSPTAVGNLQKSALPAGWALEAPTTRFPSTCFEVGYEYSMQGASLVGFLYVYDYCKPTQTDPGTYVAMIPDSVIASYAGAEAWNDGATTYGYTIEIYSADEKNLNVYLYNGSDTMQIATPSGVAVSEPDTADLTATGWSYLETQYDSAPEVCPKLPHFYGQSMTWEGANPNFSGFPYNGPSHLNTKAYKWYSPAPNNQCVVNDGKTGYYYFANYYTPQQPYRDEWRVQSLGS